MVSQDLWARDHHFEPDSSGVPWLRRRSAARARTVLCPCANRLARAARPSGESAAADGGVLRSAAVPLSDPWSLRPV